MGQASLLPLEERVPWAQKEAKEILDLFNTGMSYGQLAAKYGRTRGSISGLIDRYRKKNMVVQQVARPRRVRKLEKPKSADPIAIAILHKPPIREHRVRLRLVESETEVTFAQLQEFHCRYPYGDPKQSDFRFCGKLKCDGAPYCKGHCTLSYTGLPQRNRKPIGA